MIINKVINIDYFLSFTEQIKGFELKYQKEQCGKISTDRIYCSVCGDIDMDDTYINL